MSPIPRSLAVSAVVLISACASSSGRADRDTPLVFSGLAVPSCAFETVGEVTASATVKGDRTVAERSLHHLLARAARRQGADGIIGIRIQAPGRVPVSVPAGMRPTEADLPAVTWHGSAHTIRFVDPDCRD
jgi:hypothetical protein